MTASVKFCRFEEDKACKRNLVDAFKKEDGGKQTNTKASGGHFFHELNLKEKKPNSQTHNTKIGWS